MMTMAVRCAFSVRGGSVRAAKLGVRAVAAICEKRNDTMRRAKVSSLAVFLAAPALAQTGGTYLLTSTNTVSPGSPTTTISIWGAWDDPAPQFLFGAGDYDLTASDGQFSNPVNVLNGPSSSTGVIAGNVISGAANGRLYIPGLTCKWVGCPLGEPELLATYDWTTTDFTPRAVDLHTSNTSIFIVFDPHAGNFVRLYPHEFTPGSGVINVVPAPAAWMVLALPLVAATRRRRS